MALGKSIREIERFDFMEIMEWTAYARIEPIGDDRDDYRSGIIASTLANINRVKNGKFYTPQDFMPFMIKDDRTKLMSKRLRKMLKDRGNS